MSSELRALWTSAGGHIPDDWDVVTLETLLIDSKSIAVGVMYPGPHTPNGVPLIKVGDIHDGAIVERPTYCISEKTNEEYRRTQLRGDELLITLVGNPGECVIVKPFMSGWNPARAIAVLKLRDTSIRTYLKAILESKAGKHLIDAVLNTTVQKTLNLKDIKRLPIPLPARHIRDQISQLAEIFADRITLLRETNKTLESIAQAIFKSWFVDFDPVRAKMEGRQPEGMDEDTAALFPDSFEESELGLVPQGWKISTLGKSCSYLKRGMSPKYVEEGGVLVLNQRCVRDFSVDLTKARRHDDKQRKIEGRQVGLGDILVNSTGVGTLGRVAQVLDLPETAIADSHITLVRPSPSLNSAYLGEWMKRHQSSIEEMGEGTTGQTELSRSKLAELRILLPPAYIQDAFEHLVHPLKSRLVVNYHQASSLSTIRDTLLPRLISGRLRLLEAGAQVENALS